MADAVKRGRGGAGASVESVMVNGAPGVVLHYPARSVLAAFTVSNGRIAEINVLADPDKLRRLSPAGEPGQASLG